MSPKTASPWRSQSWTRQRSSDGAPPSTPTPLPLALAMSQSDSRVSAPCASRDVNSTYHAPLDFLHLALSPVAATSLDCCLTAQQEKHHECKGGRGMPAGTRRSC